MNRLCAAYLPLLFGLFAVVASAQSGPPRSNHHLEDCSCTAPDGSCSATISCKGGCIRFCGNNGECSAECADSPGDPTTVGTVEIKNGTYPQLVKALGSISNKNIQFTPTEPESRVDVAFKDAPLWDALEFLAARGTLRIDGTDFELLRKERKVLLTGGKTSFSVKNKSVSTFVKDMAFLTGLPLRVVAGKRTAIVNIELRNVTLRQILNAVSRQTGAKIREV